MLKLTMTSERYNCEVTINVPANTVTIRGDVLNEDAVIFEDGKFAFKDGLFEIEITHTDGKYILPEKIHGISMLLELTVDQTEQLIQKAVKRQLTKVFEYEKFLSEICEKIERETDSSYNYKARGKVREKLYALTDLLDDLKDCRGKYDDLIRGIYLSRQKTKFTIIFWQGNAYIPRSYWGWNSAWKRKMS